MLFHSFWEIIAPNSMWVNQPAKARSANCKLLQLKTATQVDLKIPETIVSNNPTKIKDFLNERGKFIYKSLYPMRWIKKDNLRLTYTEEISIKDLPPDEILKLTPGIFQRKIEKAYELRITYFGSQPISVKLLSQAHPMGKIDWRSVPTNELRIEKHKLPEIINQKCQALMKKMGLVFGCFDFIVTPEDEYYFLEVNEAGQFLWIEEVNPEIKMLDIFTDFLINKCQTFHYKNKEQSISLSDFKKEVGQVLKKSLEVHIQSDK